MDTNVVSDKKWDEWAREPVDLQKKYPDISKRVMWHEAFADWDASSGAFLPLDNPWVIKKAKIVSGKSTPNKKKSGSKG